MCLVFSQSSLGRRILTVRPSSFPFARARLVYGFIIIFFSYFSNFYNINYSFFFFPLFHPAVSMIIQQC